MSFGKMNTFIDLISVERTKDSEGFGKSKDTILASVRAYKEDRHGNEKWTNRAAFSEATALFRFRRIPDVEVSTNMVIVCNDGRYEITNVEDVKGRGMYIEALAKRWWGQVAKVQVKIPEDFLLKLSKLGDKTDEIIPKVLESGGKSFWKRLDLICKL